MLINKHTSISRYSFDKLNLNIFRISDKINPIMQNTSKLLYLKFYFVQVFNMIFARPTVAIIYIIFIL